MTTQKYGQCRDCGAPGPLDSKGFGYNCDCANEHDPSAGMPGGETREQMVEKKTIFVTCKVDTRFGPKYGLRSHRNAKDDIKALDWETTHRAWDPQSRKWMVDVDAIDHVKAELQSKGYVVVF